METDPNCPKCLGSGVVDGRPICEDAPCDCRYEGVNKRRAKRITNTGGADMELTKKEFEMVMWCVEQMQDDVSVRSLGWTHQEYAAYERALEKLKQAKVVRL